MTPDKPRTYTQLRNPNTGDETAASDRFSEPSLFWGAAWPAYVLPFMVLMNFFSHDTGTRYPFAWAWFYETSLCMTLLPILLWKEARFWSLLLCWLGLVMGTLFLSLANGGNRGYLGFQGVFLAGFGGVLLTARWASDLLATQKEKNGLFIHLPLITIFFIIGLPAGGMAAVSLHDAVIHEKLTLF